MMFLDLAEIPQVFDSSPLWSAKRPALARFRRSDFLGDPEQDLAGEVRKLVLAETGQACEGPIFLLANLRYFGYIINPLSCYYCYCADGETLQCIVAEVNNTPWDDRHHYVIPATPDKSWLRHSFPKGMHVSPFHPMEMDYHWHSNTPDRKLVLHLANSEQGQTVFDATLSLERQAVTGPNLTKALLAYPVMTAKVALAIYWQALRLWLKGVPIYSHPKPTMSTSNE